MNITLAVFILVLALVAFALATFAVKGPKGGWVPVGLFFLTLFFLIPA